MILPMTFFLTFIAVAIALTWWWISRVPVTPPQVAMMALRIAFPGGIRLADPDRAVAGLAKPDEIVIPFDHANLIIVYPLTVPATVPINAGISWGFTRGELVRAICEEYANVYEAEEATAATKTVPREERTARPERNRTDGVYGIWGYDLDELVLTSLRWTRETDGVVTIELHVEPQAQPRGTGSPSPAA
jgi:hypothetical protein